MYKKSDGKNKKFKYMLLAKFKQNQNDIESLKGMQKTNC